MYIYIALQNAVCFTHPFLNAFRDEKMDTATEPEGEKEDKAGEQNQEDTPAQSVSDQ